jgi:hypothetical protein
MSNKAADDVLTVWLTVPEEDYGDFYRDTLGGRQTLTQTDDGAWEFTQEGYAGTLYRHAEQNECVRYANNMASVDNMRIANLDAYDFTRKCFYQVASIIKHLVSGSEDQAEDGLKEIAQLEACLTILRYRLTQRTAYQSTAARAEEVSSEALRLITMFYAECMFGQVDIAGNKLVALREVADEMEAELRDMIGKPENMA